MVENFLNLLHQRKATRAIDTGELSADLINKLMQAAQLSASCFNNQPWRFLFLTDENSLDKGRKALSKGNSWAQTAPLLVVCFSKPDLDCQLSENRNYYLFDLGMATQLILLQATELNLVARPMAGFSPQILKAELSIPPEFEPFIMIAVGYEGKIAELESNLQTKSLASRTRNPLEKNFFLNHLPEQVK
ncbi:nitroreductase family protein [candidate division KSB1 bacterium]|nr:nitroreductase family protein [candidate division KSB1 bacterium]